MKLGMVFSGYGTQFVGMGKELYDQSREIQELFEEASSCLDTNFVKLCFASSDAEIKKLENAYTTLFVTSAAVTKALQEHNITPHQVAGYDFGEYAALHAINGISVPDALYLLKKYASFYEPVLTEKQVGLVRVQGASESELKSLCVQATAGDQRVDIAVYEQDNQMVLSGTQEALKEIVGALKERKGVTVAQLDPGAGLHSPLMDEIVKNVKPYLEKVDFKNTETPFISGVIGEPLQEGETIRAALMQHLHAPTQWQKVMEAFKECDTIIEVGPGSQLKELLEQVYPDKKVYQVLTPADVQQLVSG